MRFFSHFPNRTYCDTLEEMRKLLKTATPTTWETTSLVLASLIEECQVYGNRMESGLTDKKDLHEWQVERAKLRKEITELKKEKVALGGVVDDE